MQTEIIEAKPAGKEPPTPAPKKVKVLLIRFADPNYEEVLEGTNWDQVIQELFQRYPSWVIEPLWECLKLKYPDIKYLCIMNEPYLK